MNQTYPQSASFMALTESYAQYLQTLGFSAHTIKGYPQLVQRFLSYVETHGIRQINDLTHNHVKYYSDHLETRSNMRTKGKALSKAYLNKNFDAVDKFLEFLYERGMTSAPPPTNYRLQETKSEIAEKVRAFTKHEVQTLYASTEKLFSHFTFKESEPRQALAVLILDLCYGCGLRRSEAFNLNIEQVDFDNKLLFVEQAKGNKDRYVPMSETIAKRIAEFIYQHRRHFNTTTNRVFPLSFHSLPYYFKILLGCSGLNYDEGTGVHILRHSIATHLLQNGMNIEQIAKFLGHSTLESTQVYTHLLQEYER